MGRTRGLIPQAETMLCKVCFSMGKAIPDSESCIDFFPETWNTTLRGMASEKRRFLVSYKAHEEYWRHIVGSETIVSGPRCCFS